MGRSKSTRTTSTKDSSANLGFEAKLWLAADKLRNNMDAAEYKHVDLGLIFLKYISDTFEEQREKLVAGKGEYKGANPEDADEYKAENVFWVPKESRWSHLQAKAKQPSIGKLVDDAMVAIERDNPRLKGVLPKDYARPALDKQRLGELIDLIETIVLTAASGGEKALVDHIQKFLLELRTGFAFVGQQVRLEVGDEDYPFDLLFYHLKLRRYVVIELKARAFTPGDVGQLNLYLSAVDDLLRHPDDQPTIGLLLCRKKYKLVAEYALRGLDQSIAVAAWHTKLTESLPEELRGSLPSIEEIEAELASDIVPQEPRKEGKR